MQNECGLRRPAELFRRRCPRAPEGSDPSSRNFLHAKSWHTAQEKKCQLAVVLCETFDFFSEGVRLSRVIAQAIQEGFSPGCIVLLDKDRVTREHSFGGIVAIVDDLKGR